MLGDVLAQPHQLGDALWRAQSAGHPTQRPRPAAWSCAAWAARRSAATSRAAALGDRATRPITTVRGYALESWTGPDSLVLCASYSGDTEETLACFEAAGAAGAGRVALTTGGKLAEPRPRRGRAGDRRARRACSRAPRSIYMTVGALECAALCGAAPALHSEIDTAAGAARRAGDRVGAGRRRGSQPRRWRGAARARCRSSTAPAHRGGGAALEDPAQRERQGRGVLVGAAGGRTTTRSARWERGRATAPLAGVFLEDPDQHPRVQRRIELTAGRGASAPARRRCASPRAGETPPRAGAVAGAAGRPGQRLPRGAGRRRSHAGRGDRALQGRARLARLRPPTLTRSW